MGEALFLVSFKVFFFFFLPAGDPGEETWAHKSLWVLPP